MKATVSIRVVDSGREVEVSVDLDAGSVYGQHPLIGAMEKSLSLTPKIVETALKTVRS